ncbi:GntR family transcriptional regulator [Streptomyces sp. PRh5]|uniref:GntR family transcriptional regulator n=1 Tax=Streptomyces sp. PRh5 TaxID=1158056 RepID=UPI00241090F6|nr:GntR family transcriptional regulator [Streptomyces sp. PRh5]
MAKIIARIVSDELQPGDKVPSVNEIMKSEKVSRATAARVPGCFALRGTRTRSPVPARLYALRRRLRREPIGSSGSAKVATSALASASRCWGPGRSAPRRKLPTPWGSTRATKWPGAGGATSTRAESSPSRPPGSPEP